MCWECDHPDSSQLAYAHDRGHRPWDAQFRGHHGGQPLFGVRAAPPIRGAAPPIGVA